MLATRAFSGVVRVATRVDVGFLLYDALKMSDLDIQRVRNYASAAPTAAFAGQKGSNVSNFPMKMTNGIIHSCFFRVNIRSHSFQEMVRSYD